MLYIKMEYLLTEKGLLTSIIIPLVYLILGIIDIQNEMTTKVKVRTVLYYYLISLCTSILFYYFGADKYFCFIWFLATVLGYPILCIFSKLGDLTNKNLSEQAKVIYKKYLGNISIATGVIVIILIIFDVFTGMLTKELKNSISMISKCLYVVWGGFYILKGIYERRASKRYLCK